MNQQIKLSVVAVALLAAGGGVFVFLNARAVTLPQVSPMARPAPVAVVAPAAAIATAPPVADNPGVLDERRRFSLGMIETGNDDRAVGGAGEVSRYQIMPSVWRQYSQSHNYQNPDTSLEVAQQYWSALYNRFKQQTRRAPTDFDMYVLWNAGYSFYAGRGFDPAKLSSGERDRAGRYVNLVERSDD